mmetsp:Transcript_33101/g.65234  ORF Transcript_33101/g.65234 Transcript_33101/m.65234 type:complete len:865 (+) Transcript_33101:60-2654(+)
MEPLPAAAVHNGERKQSAGSLGLEDAESLRGSVVSTECSPTSGGTGQWEENASNCAICNSRVGKRYLKPRHHCRICGRCVCSGCSPNSVRLQGQQPERACKECLGRFETMTSKMSNLGKRLARLAGNDGGILQASNTDCRAVVAPEKPESFEEAVTFCEKALTPLEKEREKCLGIQAQFMQLEGRALETKAVCTHLAHRIHAVRDGGLPLNLESATFEEVVACCEAGLVALEEEQRNHQDWSPVMGVPHVSLVEADHAANLEDHPPPLQPHCGTPAASTNWGLRRMQQVLLEENYDLASVDTIPHGGARTCNLAGMRAGCRKLLCCRHQLRKLVVCLSLVLLLATMLLGGRFFALPMFGQYSLDSLPVTLEGMQFRDLSTNPEGTSFLGMNKNPWSSLQVTGTMHVGRSHFVGATIHGFVAQVRFNGTTLGFCNLPSFSVSPTSSGSVALDTVFQVRDRAAFESAASTILQGLPSRLELSGTPQVTTEGATLDLTLSKLIELPPLTLAGAKLFNLRMVSGNDTELSLVADVSFVSLTRLLVTGNASQALRLNVHCLSANGTVVEEAMGDILFPNSDLERGLNVRNNLSLVLRKASRHAANDVSDFLGRWLSGAQQTLVLRGPRGITVSGVKVAGFPGGLLQSATISRAQTLRGHDAETGELCDWRRRGQQHCLRGPMLIARSSLATSHGTVQARDINLDVNLQRNLTYDATLRELPWQIDHISCDSGNKLFRMQSMPGMWSGVDPRRSAEDSVTFHGGSTQSFLLPSHSQPDQMNGGTCLTKLFERRLEECCFSSVLPAAACYYKSKAERFIPVDIAGNLTLVVDGFVVQTSITQTGVPMSFAGDEPSFEVGPASMWCEDFDFH